MLKNRDIRQNVPVFQQSGDLSARKQKIAACMA